MRYKKDYVVLNCKHPLIELVYDYEYNTINTTSEIISPDDVIKWIQSTYSKWMVSKIYQFHPELRS